MSKPTLNVFAMSHYCEKARWALDYLKIDYVLRCVLPGGHSRVAQKLGVPGTSLPILAWDGGAIQGSADIIDWAEDKASQSLIPDNDRSECLEIEKRLDDVAGIHARRYYYSEALVDYPKTVRMVFNKDLPPVQKLLVNLQWPVIRKIMIAGMDLGPEQREQSKLIVEQELTWLDGLLSGGRHYLAGDRFSRADLTAAALLGPLATPPEHPEQAFMTVPPKMAAEMADWKRHPSVAWIGDLYREYR